MVRTEDTPAAIAILKHINVTSGTCTSPVPPSSGSVDTLLSYEEPACVDTTLECAVLRHCSMTVAATLRVEITRLLVHTTLLLYTRMSVTLPHRASAGRSAPWIAGTSEVPATERCADTGIRICTHHGVCHRLHDCRHHLRHEDHICFSSM
jgi:hypothetical protein